MFNCYLSTLIRSFGSFSEIHSKNQEVCETSFTSVINNMGINSLIPKLKNLMTEKHLSSISPATHVYIDVSLFIHQACHGLADILLESSGSNFDRFVLSSISEEQRQASNAQKEITYVEEVAKLVINKIIEVVRNVVGTSSSSSSSSSSSTTTTTTATTTSNVTVVFDGESPPLKVSTVQRRRQIMANARGQIGNNTNAKTNANTNNKNKNHKMMQTLDKNREGLTNANVNSFETKSMNKVADYKNTRKAGATSAHHVKILDYILTHLTSHNMRFIVSPYEADSQVSESERARVEDAKRQKTKLN